jgi:hypothetical protein
LKEAFTVCKLKKLPDNPIAEKFCFLSVTDSEISLVCPTIPRAKFLMAIVDVFQ